MAVGIRIRGGANQIQISDESPVYMVLYTGVINSSHKIMSVPASGDYMYYQRCYFPATITQAEAPLVFINVTNTIVISEFRLLGSPGAWTGFVVATGIGAYVDASAVGDWFVACNVVPKSYDPVGIRIRNKNTNEVIFDTGYRLVKFQTYITSYRLANQTEVNRWTSYGGGLSWAFYIASRPAGCYMLLNCLTGHLTEPSASGGIQPTLSFGFDANYPGEIYIGNDFGNPNNFNLAYYYGVFIFATAGL